jgi:tetratricopeptide (TPR) repeat protein
MMGHCLLAFACVIGIASEAMADDAAAQAKALFEEGRKLADAGQIAAACDKFEASMHLDPRKLGTTLNLADCRERQGRLLDAYGLFSQVADDVARAADGREAFVRQRIDSLLARLARVTLHITAPTSGLSVKLGSHDLASSAWPAQQIVEPGAITVDVTAPGRRPFHAERTAIAGGELAIDVPALELVAQVPIPQPTIDHERSPRSRTPFIVAGGGGALLLASLAITLHGKSRYNEAVSAGDATRVRSAQREADIATGVAIGGAVVVGIGVALYVRDRRDRPIVTPTTDAHGVGIAVSGCW